MHRLFISFLALFLLAGCSKQSRLENHLERANKAYQDGNFEVARLEYLNVIQLDPKHSEAFSRLGLIYAEAGEIPQAYQFLNRARELDSSDLAARSRLAMILAAAGQITNALNEAEFVLRERPADPEALLVIAATAISAEEITAALSRLSALLPEHQTNSALHLALGHLYQRKEDFPAAEASFRQAQAVDSSESRASLALAHLYWLQGRTNEAQASFQKAVSLAPVRSTHRLRYADFLIKTGQLPAAKALLEETIEEAPDFSSALAVLAEVALQENDRESCAKYVEEVLKREPNHRESLLVRARLRLLKGETDEALLDLEKLTDLFPRDAVAFYHLGLAFRAKQDASKAVTALDRAILLNPQLAEAVLLRAELLIGAGDAQLAIPSLLRLSQEHPRLSAAQYLLASAYRLRGSPDDALEVYARLARDFPKDPQPLYLSGLVLRQLLKFDQARKFYEAALEVMPNYVLAVDQLIELDIEKRDFAGALARIQFYIERFPDKPMPRFLQAKVYEAQQDFTRAEAALLKSIELDPDFLYGHRALAQLYISSERHEQALAKLEAVIAKNERDTGSLLQLGMLYEHAGRFSEARAAYERLLRLNPSSVPALNNLAYLLAERFEELPAALQFAQRARDAAPFEPHSADTFGWIAYKQGDYARALAVLQQAAEKLSTQPEVLYHLGMAYYMNAAEEEARGALEFAVRSAVDFNGKEEARAALAIIQINPEKASPEDVQTLRDALARNPSDLIAHLRLARIAETARNWDQALRHYQAAIEINPKSHVALLSMAAIHIKRKESFAAGLEFARQAWALSEEDEVAAQVGPLAALAGEHLWAVPILEKAYRDDPSRPEVAYYLGLSYFSLARFSQAQTVLQGIDWPEHDMPERARADLLLALATSELTLEPPIEILRNSPALHVPGYVPATFALALLKEAAGDTDGALAAFEKIVSDSPDFLPAQRRLAILMTDRFQDQAAEAIIQKLRLRLPDDLQLKAVRGKIAFRQQDYRAARRYLSEAVEAFPKNPDLLYPLGLSQFHLNDQHARATLTLALSLGSGSPLAESAREALSQLQ